jgi:cytochrome b pre-mRNA-processing protein 3
MLDRLFGAKREQARIATGLYGAIVAHARTAAFYAVLGVPDTVSGRFEMLVLHAFLVFHRLQAGTPAEHEVGQAVFDLFCADMDRSLRELGVGDLGVPKRMREVGEAFYGRTRAYDEAIARGDEAGLAAALGRNILKGAAGDEAAQRLARYVLAAAACLAAVTTDAVLRDPLPFPTPSDFAGAPAGVAA